MAIFIDKRYENIGGVEYTIYAFTRQRLAIVVGLISTVSMIYGFTAIDPNAMLIGVIGGLVFVSVILIIGIEFDLYKNVASPNRFNAIYNPFAKPSWVSILLTGKGQELRVPGRIETSIAARILIVAGIIIVMLFVMSLLP